MIQVGRYNQLTILRRTSDGLILGDEDGEEVLLPNECCPLEFNLNDQIDPFIYVDSNKKKIATHLIPKVFLHEFAFLQVTAVTEVGTFLDWGMDNEVMVPFKEQGQKMEEGRWYVVYLDIDDETGRLIASNKIEKRLKNENLTVTVDEEVELLVYKETDFGLSVIINNKHKGLVFKNEIFQKIRIGDRLQGYIKKIREENKLDVSLQPIGYKKFNSKNAEDIYHVLIKYNGYLPITDKSPPAEIYRQFGISKKAFKKAIGDLYKQRKITMEEKGIRLS